MECSISQYWLKTPIYYNIKEKLEFTFGGLKESYIIQELSNRLRVYHIYKLVPARELSLCYVTQIDKTQ